MLLFGFEPETYNIESRQRTAHATRTVYDTCEILSSNRSTPILTTCAALATSVLPSAELIRRRYTVIMLMLVVLQYKCQMALIFVVLGWSLDLIFNDFTFAILE